MVAVRRARIVIYDGVTTAHGGVCRGRALWRGEGPSVRRRPERGAAQAPSALESNHLTVDAKRRSRYLHLHGADAQAAASRVKGGPVRPRDWVAERVAIAVEVSDEPEVANAGEERIVDERLVGVNVHGRLHLLAGERERGGERVTTKKDAAILAAQLSGMGAEGENVENGGNELQEGRSYHVMVADRDAEVPEQRVAVATDAAGVDITHSACVCAADHREAWRALHLFTGERPAHADTCSAAQQREPSLQLLAHELIAFHATAGTVAACAIPLVRRVEPVHHLASHQIHSAKVLEETAKGAVHVEGLAAGQRLSDHDSRPKQLVARDDDNTQSDHQEDAQPQGVRAEVALLRDGHDEVDVVSQPPPDAKRSQRTLHTNGDDYWVVGVHERGVESQRTEKVIRCDVSSSMTSARARGAAPGGQPRIQPRIEPIAKKGGIFGVEVLAEHRKKRLAEALSDVRSTVRAKAEAQLRDEHETRTGVDRGEVRSRDSEIVLVPSEEDDTELVQLG